MKYKRNYLDERANQAISFYLEMNKFVVCDRGSEQMLGLILTIFAHSAESQFKLLKSF